MKLKVLAKVLARNNGGNIEEARKRLEQRKRYIEMFSYEDAFERDKKYFKEVNESENCRVTE